MLWRQSAWFTLENLSSALLQLLLSAWLIRQLGADGYGAWVLLMALIGLCSVVSAGIAPGLSLRVQGSENRGEQAKWLAAAVLGSGLLAGGLFLLLLLLVMTLTNAAFPHSRPGVLWPLIALQVAGSELVAVFAATLRGLGDYRATARTSVVVRLISFVALAWLGWRYQRLELLLLVTALAAVAQAGSLAWLLRRRGVRSELPSRAIVAELRELLEQSRWQWLKAIGGVLFGSVDKLLVGHLLGTATLAVYAVCLQLSDPLHRIVAMLTQPLMLWAGRSRDAGIRLFVHWRRFLLIEVLVIAAGLLTLLVAPMILPWWLGDLAANHRLTVQLAVFGSTLAALNALAHHLQIGMGQLRRMAWSNLMGGAIAVAAIALTGGYGLTAVMLSRCLFGLSLFSSWPALLRASKEG